MGDKTTFEGLWNYEKQHLDMNGLMNWAISATGTTTGMGAATDADEDMAFALAMADKQWGGYTSAALAQIKAVWNFEIWESKLPRNGDGWGDWNNLNISYFAPAYYRIFKMLDTDSTHKWDDVITTVYDTLKAAVNSSNGNTTNGLVPAWCNSTGGMASTGPGQGPEPYYYQYDSCRTPFRIGLDWCWFGEARAQTYVALTSNFFSGIGAANIVDGYDMNGNKHVQFSPSTGTPTLAQQSAAFVGPAAVGAMSSSSYQAFVDAAYARLATRQMLVGGAYYDESWNAMSLLMLTGNFLNYMAIQPVH
jgi:endo-1,4-beta-D-glucanase Y